MKKTSVVALGVMALLGAGPRAFAADHLDGTTSPGTAALGDPSADITDTFAWMSSDAGTVNLVMDVFPAASSSSVFSTSVKYVFHTLSETAYGGTATKRNVICTFAGATAPQTASCWITDPANSNAVVDYVTGDASTSLTSASAKIKVFAGIRNDPFFFNLAGFRTATSTVAAAVANFAGGGTTYITGFDTFHANAAKCPVLHQTAARAVVAGRISKACDGLSTAQDFFKKPDSNAAPVACTTPPALVHTATVNEGTTSNILALVVTVDKTLLTPGGPILGVWAATTK